MRTLALLLAACTAPDRDPAEAPSDTDGAPDEGQGSGELFDRAHVGTIDLQLTEEASAALASDEGSTSYVESRVELSLGGEPITLDRVGVQVKGSTTFVAWPGKSSLKVKFDEYVPGQDVDGVERIALHNLVTDPSFLREGLAWWAFRELGSPAARATHVAVLDRGEASWEPNNLYLMVEALNGDFLEEWFDDPSGPMWEGIANGLANGGLWCDHGDCTDTSKLEALSAAILESTDEQFVDAVGAYLDWDAFLRYWAVEVMVQQTDGFAAAGHNFRVYWEPTEERFYLVPWSLDMTFRDQGTVALMAGNDLVQRCLVIDTCRADLYEELVVVADAWEEKDAVAELDRMQALLEAEGYADEASTAEYAAVRAIVEETPGLIRRFVEQN